MIDSEAIASLEVEGKFMGYGRIAGRNMENASWTPIWFGLFKNNSNLVVIHFLGNHCLFFQRYNN